MSRVWVAIKRTWKVFGIVCGCIVFAVCIFMLWRVFSTGTPGEIDKISSNEKLLSAYAEKGDGLYMFKQHQDIITRADHNSGYFSIPDYVFIPDANQLQLVFRYNNSTLKYLARDKKLDKVPDCSGDYFDVSAVVYIDLTPDDKEDNYVDITPENPNDNEYAFSDTVKQVRCKSDAHKKDKTTLYNFYRYTFEFDELEEYGGLKKLIDEGKLFLVYADFYYNENLDYNEKAYGTLVLYNYEDENKQVKLSSADKKALAK